jgi:hypothetical protein
MSSDDRTQAKGSADQPGRSKSVVIEITHPDSQREHRDRVRRFRASVNPEALAVIEEHLGLPGRMVSGSKSSYRRRHPSRLVAFNANLLIEGEKVWWGDIDVTADEKALVAIAGSLDADVRVLYELDGRFRNEKEPKRERFLYWSNGREHRLGKREAELYERRRGRILRKRDGWVSP